MPRLILINGSPGSGKTTIAHALAQTKPLSLALDIDAIKHSLGLWNEGQTKAGLHARRLTLALAREQLNTGHDVILGQYLARPDFIEALATLATELSVPFFEFVLDLRAPVLAVRLADRQRSPSRPEHEVNNRLVGPDDADRLVESLHALREARPRAVWVDAEGSMSETLDLLERALGDDPGT